MGDGNPPISEPLPGMERQNRVGRAEQGGTGQVSDTRGTTCAALRSKDWRGSENHWRLRVAGSWQGVQRGWRDKRAESRRILL